MVFKKENFIFVFSIVLASFLVSISISFLALKEIDWILVLGTSFGASCGALIWLRHFSRKKSYEGNVFLYPPE